MSLWDCGQAAWVEALESYAAVIRRLSDEKSRRKKREVAESETLFALDHFMTDELAPAVTKRGYMDKSQLRRLMTWKLTRGKFRPQLQGLIERNSDEAVQEATEKLGSLAADDILSVGLDALVELKGVGPATASAILALWHPDEAAFLSDEAMLAVPLLDGKKDYSAKTLKSFTREIVRKSHSLTTSDRKWKPGDVEKALFAWSHKLDSSQQQVTETRKRKR